MLRTKTLLIGFLILAGTLNAQERTSLKHEGLRGPVRTVYIVNDWIAFQNGALIQGHHLIPRLDTFDPSGNKTGVSYFESKGGVKLVYTNKPEQKTIERTDYNPDGTAGSKHTFAYDEKGNIIESIYNIGGERSGKLINSYDEKDRIIKEIMYGLDEKPVRTDEFKYKLDVKGNAIEKLTYINSQYETKTVYSYDAQGNVTERADYDAGGFPIQNLPPSHSSKKVGPAKESFAYEYDSRGNWTKQTKSMWDVEANKFIADEVTYRTITYY